VQISAISGKGPRSARARDSPWHPGHRHSRNESDHCTGNAYADQRAQKDEQVKGSPPTARAQEVNRHRRDPSDRKRQSHFKWNRPSHDGRIGDTGHCHKDRDTRAEQVTGRGFLLQKAESKTVNCERQVDRRDVSESNLLLRQLRHQAPASQTEGSELRTVEDWRVFPDDSERCDAACSSGRSLRLCKVCESGTRDFPRIEIWCILIVKIGIPEKTGV